MDKATRRIIFYRHYLGYTGGHQKVRDYFAHIDSDDKYSASIFLDNASQQSTPFDDIPLSQRLKHYQPHDHDLVFLAGMDWQAYLAEQQARPCSKPVINLIQHLRHADPAHPLHQFLHYPATRICVSEAVAGAIRPFANGPVHTIKMGHDIPLQPSEAKSTQLYIMAKKRPGWGRVLADHAKAMGMSVILHDFLVAKEQVLSAMQQSRISLVLPNPTEGFFLPGIEAMALSDIAIVPNCRANLEYMDKASNALLCANTLAECKQAISTALNMLDDADLPSRVARGRKIAASYDLRQERESLLSILAAVTA